MQGQTTTSGGLHFLSRKSYYKYMFVYGAYMRYLVSAQRRSRQRIR